MISIRSWFESTSPATEWMETLPKDTEYVVVIAGGEIRSIFEKVEIDGKTALVERILDTGPFGRINAALFKSAKSLPEG